GALASAEVDAYGDALIVTGARDMYQCVGEHVHVLYRKSGISGFEEVDASEVERRYGIPPALVPDFIALRGDPSDGLPGAQGVGAKTAAALLAHYGSLEALLEAAEDISAVRALRESPLRPRTSAALRESAEQLRAFKE